MRLTKNARKRSGDCLLTLTGLVGYDLPMPDETTAAFFDPVREAEYEGELNRIVLAACHGLSCRVTLFGSRASGRATRSSDFDLAFSGLDERAFIAVRRAIVDAVEESRIPHDVDVVDIDRAAEPFRSMVLQGPGIVWKND